MTNLATRLLALLAAIGGALALLFRARGQQHQAEAALANEREAAAAEAVALRRRIDAARQVVKKKHRRQQRQTTHSIERGERDHLEGDW